MKVHYWVHVQPSKATLGGLWIITAKVGRVVLSLPDRCQLPPNVSEMRCLSLQVQVQVQVQLSLSLALTDAGGHWMG
jgi:hypothetical protein